MTVGTRYKPADGDGKMLGRLLMDGREKLQAHTAAVPCDQW